MANKTYAIKMADGSVGIMTIVESEVWITVEDDKGIEVFDRIETKISTVEAEIAKWPNASDVVSHVEIAAGSQPRSREFRDAWDVTSGIVDVDMTKARIIHRDNLRTTRLPLMAVLDVDYQRADEVPDHDAKERIILQKQALRDVTAYAAIDEATTPEELSAAIPDCLK